MIDKLRVFKDEINAISDANVKDFIIKVISSLPEYFFDVAASSTGKYHPKYALGLGGLVRHTKAAVAIASDLLKLEQYKNQFSDFEIDCMIAALIVHDGWKHGEKKSQYTVAEHPTIAANHIRELDSEGKFALIADCVATHMGEFNTDFKTKKEIMPKPETDCQKFVHLCDYLASRKYLEFEFSNYYSPEQYEIKEESELEKSISALINLCKSLVSEGYPREELYKIISEANDGRRNPNSITDLEVAKALYTELETKRGINNGENNISDVK